MTGPSTFPANGVAVDPPDEGAANDERSLRSDPMSTSPVAPLDTLDGEISSIDLVPLPLLVLEDDLRAVAVNAAWEQMSGCSGHDCRGTLWWNRIDARDRESLRRSLGSAEPVGVEVEHRLVTAEGTRWTRWWWQRRAGRIWVCLADVELERARARELLRRATHDPLTGLANRTEFMHLLERAVDRAGHESSLGVVYVDLDDFKAVNDSYGHRAGDEVLIASAEAIVGAVRPFDVAGRLGGDEFAVLCPGVERSDDVEELSERVRSAIASSAWTTGIPISATVGVATSVSGESPDGLVSRADREMYRRKAGRKDLVVVPGTGQDAGFGADISDAEQLCSVLVPMLFRVSLTLHGAAASADEVTASRVLDAVDELDDVIASLRRAALGLLRHRMGEIHLTTLLSRLEEVIDHTGAALQAEWAQAWDSSATPGGPGDPAQLARVVQLLRGARRLLDPDAIG
jgi:diguanylate cyclase (GGDEF)-like protein